MSSSNLPVILFVPGAFGLPSGFDKLIPHLDGIPTHPGAYPSCNHPDPLNATCADDIAALRSIILSLLDQQKDVVLFCHSFGGVVGGGAAKDLDRETRKAQGYSSAVTGLLYVAGNIALEGETLLESIGGAYPEFIKQHTPSQGLCVLKPAMDILYNDCDPALQAELEASVNPHALKAFETKPSAPAWADKGFDGRRFYVRTLDDCTNPLVIQDAWMKKSQVEWEVANLQAGHMPFISQPEALGALIVKFVRHLQTL